MYIYIIFFVLVALDAFLSLSKFDYISQHEKIAYIIDVDTHITKLISDIKSNLKRKAKCKGKSSKKGPVKSKKPILEATADDEITNHLDNLLDPRELAENPKSNVKNVASTSAKDDEFEDVLDSLIDPTQLQENVGMNTAGVNNKKSEEANLNQKDQVETETSYRDNDDLDLNGSARDGEYDDTLDDDDRNSDSD